jgi:hypothetical protein
VILTGTPVRKGARKAKIPLAPARCALEAYLVARAQRAGVADWRQLAGPLLATAQTMRGISSRADLVCSYPALSRREIASGDQSEPLSPAGFFMSIMRICRTRA